MNIQSNDTIFQANNSLENQNKQEIFFTTKLVKSGLADMLWQLSLLYRIGQLFDYTYVHTLISHDKRHRLSLFGKITKKLENVIAKFLKIDRYSYKISNFMGLDTIGPNINDKNFIDYKVIEIPIDKIYQESEISDIAQLKKRLKKFIDEITPSSKKVIYRLAFTPELYKSLRAYQLDELLKSADPEAIQLKPLKLKLSEGYRKARENRPINIPFDAQKVKIVVHLRKGDRVRLNINKKILGVFSTRVKVFENTSDLNEWESTNYSSSNDTYSAYNLIQRIFDKYGKENFSVIVISDGYERTFQNIRHAMSKGEIELSQNEKNKLDEIEKIANKEFDIFAKYSNIFTMIGESEQNTFPSIHAVISADIVIKTTGGFAWVLHSLFKNQNRPSTIIQLEQDEDKSIENIGLFLAGNVSGNKKYK
ncbi:hypothetical protein BV372_16760 [Nostoc sp. T09]|uniref:hypothetical protein n=1 Tax=Nostoc sp. T09 TaxID=1932621 RepID=UPI000A374532|nr:hypothetical protein [Nostoc sp. T09]OUL33343.1 hypothetical protein BV372_16760 [Nostoc sp. T09]